MSVFLSFCVVMYFEQTLTLEWYNRRREPNKLRCRLSLAAPHLDRPDPTKRIPLPIMYTMQWINHDTLFPVLTDPPPPPLPPFLALPHLLANLHKLFLPFVEDNSRVVIGEAFRSYPDHILCTYINKCPMNRNNHISLYRLLDDPLPKLNHL